MAKKATETKAATEKAYLVVRMRGSWGSRSKTEGTLRLMHLTRRYHATVLRANGSSAGMLKEGGNYLAWGPADAKTLESMLTKRAEVLGGKPLTTEYLSKNSKYKSLSDFAGALAKGDATMTEVKGLKPLFRLHPPRGGIESVKRSGKEGSLGNRGAAVNEMVMRML